MKVSIVGVGKVGAALGLTLIAQGLVSELVLIGRQNSNDQAPSVAVGEAMDLLHASAFTRPADVRAGQIADAAGSDVIVICAASPATPLNRNSGASANAVILKSLIPALVAVSPGSILLITTNPLDAMTTLALKLSQFPPGKVLGTGTLLDTMRLRALLSEKCGIHPRDIRAYVLGEHGDTQFVAYSSASAGGARIDLGSKLLGEMEAATRVAGYDILRHKGHTSAGVAMAAAAIIQAIANDSHEVMPVSTLVSGFAGITGVCLSLPVVIGRKGVLKALDIELTTAEREALQRSAVAVQRTIQLI